MQKCDYIRCISALIVATLFAAADAALPINCLPVVAGDFQEYYEIHGKAGDLLPYRANLNKSVEQTFTDNHFLGDTFRLLVSDEDPAEVLLLVKYPKQWRFYHLDREEYFSREPDLVHYAQVFTHRSIAFYGPQSYVWLNAAKVDDDITEQKTNLTDLPIDAATKLKIVTECFAPGRHCVTAEDGKLGVEALAENYVVQSAHRLQIMAMNDSNEFYIHDTVTGFDFCFPETLRTHSDCENTDKFSPIQSRFPIVRADSPFLRRRWSLAGKSWAEASAATPDSDKGCEPPKRMEVLAEEVGISEGIPLSNGTGGSADEWPQSSAGRRRRRYRLLQQIVSS